MATIEERANIIALGIYSGWDTERIRQLKIAAVAAATEQERISKAEEQERAELNFCIVCDCYDYCDQRYNCELFNKFRKLMKGE